ncbi:integrase_H2C2 domain-containing protein [Trichonephila clavipes]|nr:integrase_H2C2 domain-containing protein [Trichonephila clavipes]
MLQECWTLKVKWDSELPASIWQKFQKWKDQLDRLKAIAVPRCMIEDPETSQNLSLHVFCDASKAAYATCIFLRSENENSASCQLVQARSRVAPLKSISIPRLELLACTIGARLARTVKEDLKLPSLPVFYWSDSTNALYWIKKSENWAVFVSNRVKEIRNLSNPDDWYYVPGSKIQQTFPLEDAAWMFWQNQNGGKALIGSEVLQKTGRSKKFILTLKSLTLKKKDSHFRHQFGDKQI